MAKVKKTVHFDRTIYIFKCPGCRFNHHFITEWDIEKASLPPDRRLTWNFNGSVEMPTFEPSLVNRYTSFGKNGICHLFVTLGRIAYLPDCTHALAGKNVEMEDIF